MSSPPHLRSPRPLALGLAFTGAGVSSFAFAPLFQWLLGHDAWRGTLLLVAAAPSAWRLRCPPPTPLPEGAAGSGPGARLASLPHPGPFLPYSVALTLISTGYFTPCVHPVAHLRDLDWDPLPAAFLLSVVAISVLVGQVVLGWLGEAVPGPVALP